MAAEWFLIALSTLVSEDLTCLATGLLVAQGRISFASGTLVCLAGIFVGDLALFAAGRIFGRRALRWGPLARLIPEERLQQSSRWLASRGLLVIVLSRFTPGLRLPTYFMAGLLRTRLAPFALYLLIASAVWTPLLVGAAAAGSNIAGYGLAIPVLFLLLRIPLRGWRRLARWEFWPAWAAYLPVVPYLIWLAIRHRSLTLFTAANPGIFTGGLMGESKAESLRQLSAAADFELIPAGLSYEARLERTLRFPFPLVLKPDRGERGAGVAIIRNEAQRDQYLRAADDDMIVQRYVPGVEFGVFYCRMPGEARGRILSITEKLFPVLVGNGRGSLAELVQRNERASLLAETYSRLSPRPMDGIPTEGERVQLVEIGSHCLGAIFLNGERLLTPALEEAIDRIAQSHQGFYFGRFDLRAPSIEEFRRGIGLQVLELNGVAGEPAHIYDPSVNIVEAYRSLFGHWRLAFAIGGANVERGARAMPAADLLRLVVSRRRAVNTAR